MQNYRIINLKELKNNGYLRFQFDVSIGIVTIKACTLLEKDGKYFVNFPAQKYEDSNGYMQFNSVVEITDSEKKALTNYVLEAVGIIVKNIKCQNCNEYISEMLVDYSHGAYCPFCQQKIIINRKS